MQLLGAIAISLAFVRHRPFSEIGMPVTAPRADSIRMEVTPQPAVASVDFFASVSDAAPEDLAVISRPFLFISNLCFRSRLLTNSRAALATAPGRLDASTMTVDSLDSSFRSR